MLSLEVEDAMRCPVCGQDQVIVEWHDVELDLCVEGHGVWFDEDELRQLFDASGAPEMLRDLESGLETLPREAPSASDARPGHGPRRRCPRCRVKMDHVRAPGRPEPVVLDRCPRGHGLWFDEGELEQVLRSEVDEDAPSLARVRAFLGDFARRDAHEAPAAEANQAPDASEGGEEETT